MWGWDIVVNWACMHITLCTALATVATAQALWQGVWPIGGSCMVTPYLGWGPIPMRPGTKSGKFSVCPVCYCVCVWLCVCVCVCVFVCECVCYQFCERDFWKFPWSDLVQIWWVGSPYPEVVHRHKNEVKGQRSEVKGQINWFWGRGCISALENPRF